MYNFAKSCANRQRVKARSPGPATADAPKEKRSGAGMADAVRVRSPAQVNQVSKRFPNSFFTSCLESNWEYGGRQINITPRDM